MTEPTADGLLHLLKAEPSLLPPAPADRAVWAAAIEYRRADEIHTCLRCGNRANVAYIADTELGPRWLDLCPGCAHWVGTTST